MKKILFVAYKFFDEDPRIVREAAACLRNGYKIDVICVGRTKEEYAEPPDGVTLFSPVIERKRASKLRYIFEYLYFFLYSFLLSAYLQIKRKYKIVQVFVMPELLVFSVIISKLLGAKILMDWEDPSLEVYYTKYSERKGGFYASAIKIIEKLAVNLSDVVITPNIGFNKSFRKRGINTDKFKIVMNAPDSAIFGNHETRSNRISPKHYSILFNGTIFERHGLHVAIKAIEKVKKKKDSVMLYIVGDGENDYKQRCKELIYELNLEENVTFIPRLLIEEIPPIIHSTDAGIVPNISTPFTEINMPQRILEFGLLKKPIIIPRLSGILDYISEEEAYFFKPDNEHDLAKAIIQLKSERDETEKRVEALYKKCLQFDWENEYLNTIRVMEGKKAFSCSGINN